MKLEDVVTRFLRDHEDVPQSFKTYGYVLNPMVAALGPKRAVRNVSVMDIKDYAYDLKKKTYRGKTYSESTVIYHENVIKIFFRWCVTHKVIKTSPADVLKGGQQPMSDAEEKAIQEDELEKLLDFAKWDKRLYAILLFLAHTGCRAEGVSSLTLKDLDLEKGQAIVTEKAKRGKKQRRVVIFGPVAGHAIKTWLESRNRKIPPHPNQTVFSISGKAITSSVITSMIGRTCDKVGIRHMGAHAIRHRFGHMMALRGVPASITAVFMGHSNPTTTLRVYYPRDLETGRDAWERFVSGRAPVDYDADSEAELEQSGKLIRPSFR